MCDARDYADELMAVRLKLGQGITGTVAQFVSATSIQVALANIKTPGFDGVLGTADDITRTLAVRTSPADNCALLLITSGNAMWKLYRLDSGSNLGASQDDLEGILVGGLPCRCGSVRF